MNSTSRSRRMVIQMATSMALIICTGSFAAERSDPPLSAGQNQFDEESGAKLYQGVCQSCHMDQGQGASGAGAFPALRANPRLAGAAYPIYNILHGKGGMPAVGGKADDSADTTLMTDAQVANVVNYVRSHFDNHYTDIVTPDDVKRLR